MRLWINEDINIMMMLSRKEPSSLTKGVKMTSKRVECDFQEIRGELIGNFECGSAQPSLFLIFVT